MSREVEPFAPGVLAQRRAQAQLSQARLAAAIGVSVRQIAYYEQGRHSPSPAMLKKLAGMLDTPAQVLAGVPEGEETLADLRRFAGLDRATAAGLLSQNVPGVTVWKLQALESGVEVKAWQDPVSLKQVITELGKLYGIPTGTVRQAWSRAFPQQVHLLRLDPSPQPASLRSSAAGEREWRGLNSRQRCYLLACFHEDQLAEELASRDRANRHDPGPAGQWRKLPFTVKADPAFTGYTRIQERLRELGHHDSGAGATLQALARRKLILVSEDEVEVFALGFVPRVLVELTRYGRACARFGLGQAAPARPPAHLLSEWLWSSLVKVAAAGADGLPEGGLWGKARFYLGTGFRPKGSASRGFIDAVPIREDVGGDSYIREYRWQVTESGLQHLRQYLDTYRGMYPAVDTDGINQDL
ncbi:helix-turn-helix domain-containing protein [Nonomuraea dietziae]|uniref:helix-turn-helix domain-containing protein n=1 Tax=Nonomuraea dietziae TaxID=65515 RepID=UPI0033FAEDAC